MIEWQVWCAGEMVAIRQAEKEEYLVPLPPLSPFFVDHFVDH